MVDLKFLKTDLLYNIVRNPAKTYQNNICIDLLSSAKIFRKAKALSKTGHDQKTLIFIVKQFLTAGARHLPMEAGLGASVYLRILSLSECFQIS